METMYNLMLEMELVLTLIIQQIILPLIKSMRKLMDIIFNLLVMELFWIPLVKLLPLDQPTTQTK